MQRIGGRRMRRGGQTRKRRLSPVEAQRVETGPTGEAGLMAHLRRPPGGRDARLMLLAQSLDRTGSGVWGASSVLFFTFVAGLDAGELGLLLGTAGLVGIAGSPLAGRLAGHFPVRGVLIGCHLLRLGTL